MHAEDLTDNTGGAIRPFMRWVGGKRRQAVDIATRCAALLAMPDGRYIEPFLGGGAVALAMPAGTPMILSDANTALGYLWWWIQQDHRAVLDRALSYGVIQNARGSMNSRLDYLTVREAHNAQPFDADDPTPSARFLWLQGANFNGLYRESSQGQYNTPYGDRKRVTLPTAETLGRVSAHLQTAEIRPGWDFEHVVDEAVAGDVIYADPPYDVPLKEDTFTDYVKDPFRAFAQERLVDALNRARSRGVTCIATNANTPRIHDLYAGWDIERVVEARMVAADPSARVPASCLIMTGGPL